LSRGAAGVARRHAQGGVGPPARGTPRGGQGAGDGPRAEADRQRAGGARADRVGARGCAGAARRQARAAADAVHRLARRPRGRRRRARALREPGHPRARHRRRPRAGGKVRAVLDTQRGGRARSGPSHAVRALRAGRDPRAMTLVLVLAAVVVVLDQVTKAVALAHLIPGHPLVLADRWLSLTLVMNPGLPSGLLGTIPPAWRWVVAALSIVALLVLARVALRALPAGSFIAGPVATTILADLGADVIKLEPPDGDPYRHRTGGPGVPDSPYNYRWIVDNRTKRGLALDLRRAEGRAVLHRLVRSADVFVT